MAYYVRAAPPFFDVSPLPPVRQRRERHGSAYDDWGDERNLGLSLDDYRTGRSLLVDITSSSPTAQASSLMSISAATVATAGFERALQAAPLFRLPAEMLRHIFVEAGKADVRDAVALSQACVHLRQLAQDDLIWLSMLPDPRALRPENHQTWREIAIGQLSRYCTGCQRPCNPPIFARLDSRLPHGFVGGFCRECFNSATAATQLTRRPAEHTRIYWLAREERYGRCYTASERRNDAFQRHVDLFRVAPELWHVNIMKPSDMPSWCSLPFQRLCRAYLFHSTANAVHLDTILQAREVLQRRWIEFRWWILGNSWTHLRATRRLRRQQDEDDRTTDLTVIALGTDDRPNLWQNHAEADEQRPHLNVKKLGVALNKAEMKVLSRTFGRPSLQKGDPDYTYDLTNIILRNRNDQLPLETQVDLVPSWLALTSLAGDCGCVRRRCTNSSTPGCICCLCSEHCTALDRQYLRVDEPCPVHPQGDNVRSSALATSELVPAASR